MSEKAPVHRTFVRSFQQESREGAGVRVGNIAGKYGSQQEGGTVRAEPPGTERGSVVRHRVLSGNTVWVVALAHRVAAHRIARLNRSGLGGKVLEQGVLTTQNQSRMVWAY